MYNDACQLEIPLTLIFERKEVAAMDARELQAKLAKALSLIDRQREIITDQQKQITYLRGLTYRLDGQVKRLEAEHQTLERQIKGLRKQLGSK
jgi:septal ring factor EnvC (AmiA/AmiB activator)